MSTTTNHYDLIVLGSDVAGLVAAALVARRGKRVLVLPHGPVDGTYRVQGRVLPLDAAPILHLGSPAVERVFGELGLQQQIRRQIGTVSGLVHSALTGARIDLEPGGRNLHGEFQRLWPGTDIEEAWNLHQRWARATDEVLDELLASDNALSPDGFWGRRFLAKVAENLPQRDLDDLAPLPSEHPLRPMIAGTTAWLSHLSSAQLGKAAALRLARRWSLGPEDLPGGKRRIRECLLQRLELHSGEIKRDLRVGELLIRRGKMVGVSLLGKHDRYGCDHLILATDPRSLLEQGLVSEVLPKTLLHTLAGLRPVARRFVMHLEVDEQGVTPALEGMVVCTPDSVGDAAEVGHTYLRPDPPTGDALRRISITRIVDAQEPLGDMRQRILDELDRRAILPFVRPWIRWCHSPHDGRPPENGHGEPVGEPSPGPSTAVTMAGIYGGETEPVLGFGLVPQASGIRGLSFASKLSLPGLGLEGEFAAGAAAANTVVSPSRSALARSSLIRRV